MTRERERERERQKKYKKEMQFVSSFSHPRFSPFLPPPSPFLPFSCFLFLVPSFFLVLETPERGGVVFLFFFLFSVSLFLNFIFASFLLFSIVKREEKKFRDKREKEQQQENFKKKRKKKENQMDSKLTVQ